MRDVRRRFAAVFTVAAAVWWAGSARLLAEGGADVAGRVLDASGAALVRAPVALRNLATGFERLAHTDGAGRFAFAGVGPGRHELTAGAPGFASASREVEVGGTRAPLEIVLAPAPIVEQVTVVSGSRQAELREQLATRVDVVTRERARDTGYESVGELLREVPGVMTRRGSETAVVAGEQVQGIDSRQVLVLLDGQPIVGARGVKRGALNLDRQSVGRLERVEVVKGASSALYGSDAIGGVINLVTREAARPFEGSATASGGSLGTLDGRGEAAFVRGRWSGVFSLERHQGDGFDLFPSTPDTTGAAFRRHDGYAKLRFAATPALAFTAFSNGYWNDSSGRVVGEQGLQRSDVAEDAQNHGLTADWRPSARSTLQVRGYHARFDELSDATLLAPGAPAVPRDELHERLGKLDATLTRIAGERHLLQAGAEWWHDEYSGVNRLRDDSGESVTTAVAWVQDRISLPWRATLTLGARLDDHSSFGSAFSPKAALNVRLAEGAHLRASYGRGFRAPDLGQLYYRFLNPTNLYQVIGNPDLEPERASSYQLGAELAEGGGRARLGLNLFRNDVRDLIESVSLGFVASPAQLAAILEREGIDPGFRPVLNRLLFFYKNVAEARTQGVELDGEAVLPGGFSLSGAYSYLDAEDRDTGLALTNRNEHQGFARLAWSGRRTGTRANLRATFFSSWVASRSTTAAGTTETIAPGFQLWDLYVGQRVRGGLEAFLAVDNLGDSRDPNTGLLDASGRARPIYRAEAGRTFRVGLRLELAREGR
jgi:outer membrane receptor for ferrienterochelin and colicins